MNLWEKILYSPDVAFSKYHYRNHIRYFHLSAEPIKHQIIDEISIDALGYNGSTPGEVIVVKQGEWISLTVENKLEEPTALHVHGLSKPNSEDGVPDLEPNNPKIMPGTSHTYFFQAWQVGTFFYHSSMEQQASQGLIGAFVVIPNDDVVMNYPIPNRDYILLLQQWDIPQPQLGEIKPGNYKPNKFDRHPNFFTINGKAFPNTTPLVTNFNDTVRIRFINKSSNSHTMHVHGHDFKIVAVDGFPRNEFADTVHVPSGKRIEVEIKAINPGIWPINGTKTFHQSNNGKTPGGMTTRIKYE